MRQNIPASQCLESSCSDMPSAKEAMAKQGSNTCALSIVTIEEKPKKCNAVKNEPKLLEFRV